MRKKQFLSLLAAAALVCGLVGCQADTDTGQVDTEQTVQETQQTTETTSKQTEQPIDEIEATEEINSAQTTQSLTETQIETEDFVYPDDPLTAENLLKITTEAKVRLVQSGQMKSPWMTYRFGLIDADFDGFPELILEICNANIKNHDCSLYSLKEENFCEKLLDFNAYYEFRSQGDSTYYEKKYGEKAIVVDTWWDADSHGLTFVISEIKYENGDFSFNEKFYSHWSWVCNGDNTYGYVPYKFYVDGNEVDLEEYEKEYLTYMYYSPAVEPAEYVYEGIDFTCKIDSIYEITDENYDELYSLYNSYVNFNEE